TAPSQPVGRTSTTPIERPSTHLDRRPRCDHRILQPAQKRIDTAAHFGLEHGRFRCPFAEQNKKEWDHPPSPTNARRIDSGYKTKRIGNSMTTNPRQTSTSAPSMWRRIFCSLFLIAALLAAVGAIGSSRAGGSSRRGETSGQRVDTFHQKIASWVM